MPPFASSNQSAVVCWWFGDAAGVVVGTSHGRTCFSYQRTHCGGVAANNSTADDCRLDSSSSKGWAERFELAGAGVAEGLALVVVCTRQWPALLEA